MTIKNSTILEYLISDFTVSIKDPLWGDMLFTPQMAKFYQTPEFQKLGRIRQLGPAVSLLYPGALHNRLSHSLGVCTISRRILISLIRKNCVNLTKVGVNSFLVASLLHDLGHFPYAHSLKDVVTRTHESLATDLIRNTKNLKNIINDCGADLEMVCNIIDPQGAKEEPDSETKFYQHLLSGALDPDKLDYLCRDAYFCGVPYGVQDVSYIVEHIIATDNRPALFSSNMASVEHLLFSKYLMYKNVYWHKATRSATAMVKKAVKCALTDEVIKEEDLFFIDDEEFINLCNSKDYEPFSLITKVRNGKLFQPVLELSYGNSFSTNDRIELETTALEKAKGKCKSFEVIVDIPEPISFETDILLLDQNGNKTPFSQADDLFKGKEVSEAFTKALRKIRVFSPVNIFN
ncbi:MAG: HD domain-containing protein [Sphaerochaetaceae bacterium]|nr:HD domain-containing protein [Sphaerochaetaceae bacterium]